MISKHFSFTSQKLTAGYNFEWACNNALNKTALNLLRYKKSCHILQQNQVIKEPIKKQTKPKKCPFVILMVKYCASFNFAIKWN